MLRERTDINAPVTLVQEAHRFAHPLKTMEDLDPLLERIGEARFVLLGEASHGTSEYYQWRARISRRLITEKGFSFVAVEGGLAGLLSCQSLRQRISRRRQKRQGCAV